MEVMQAQLEELKSRTELNKAQTREAEKKSEFWDRALAGVSNKNIVLELRYSTEPVNKITLKHPYKIPSTIHTHV
jgi:hypothetical protein